MHTFPRGQGKTSPSSAQDPLKVQCKYLGGERLNRFKVEVVIQVQIVEVLTVNEKVEHVVALAANLQPHLHPIQLGRLEEFGGFEGSEEIPGMGIRSESEPPGHLWNRRRLNRGPRAPHLFFWAFGGRCFRAFST